LILSNFKFRSIELVIQRVEQEKPTLDEGPKFMITFFYLSIIYFCMFWGCPIRNIWTLRIIRQQNIQRKKFAWIMHTSCFLSSAPRKKKYFRIIIIVCTFEWQKYDTQFFVWSLSWKRIKQVQENIMALWLSVVIRMVI